MSVAPRQYLWLSTAAVSAAVLIAAAAGIYGVRYVTTSWQILANARSELALLEARRSEIDTATSALDGLARQTELLEKAFADPADPLPFIEAIETLGRRSDVIVNLELAPGSGGAAGEEYVLKAEGSFSQVAAFFQNLEALPFLIETGDASLEAGSSAPGTTGKGKPPPASPVELTITIRVVHP